MRTKLYSQEYYDNNKGKTQSKAKQSYYLKKLKDHIKYESGIRIVKVSKILYFD